MPAPMVVPVTPSTDEAWGFPLKLCHHAHVVACAESAVVTGKLSTQCVSGKILPVTLGWGGRVRCPASEQCS